jgi:tetratricopeptide (TPR) repeat protein
VLLQGKGDLEGAEAAYINATKRGADHVTVYAHNSLGNLLVDKGELDRAAAAYRAALKIDPRDANVHVNLGSALMAQGNYGDAITSFRSALEFDPGNESADRLLHQAIRCNTRLSIPAECPICWEPMVDTTVLQCGHRWCTTCIEQLPEPRHCPMCGLPVSISHPEAATLRASSTFKF